MFKWLFRPRGKGARHRVKIVSPKAPSGAAWLINALICLGIRVGRESSPEPGTFVRGGDGVYRLHEAEANLKLHFPVLAEKTEFVFREDVIVEWTHDWPAKDDSADEIFIFVRDPRDALFSLYKRRNATGSFGEFVHSLDYVTLLDQVDSWKLFIDSWVSRGYTSVLRFEDFKTDPELNLSSLLSKMGVKQLESDKMRLALESSRIENARKIEDRLTREMGSYFTSGSPLNRKGMPFEWKTQYREYESEYKYITGSCAAQLTGFGYELLPEIASPRPVRLSALGLAFNLAMPERIMSDWIMHLDADQKVSILKFYDDFLGSGESKYGFYEPWERGIFEKNMAQFVRLIAPDFYAANSTHSLQSLVPMAIKRLSSSSP